MGSRVLVGLGAISYGVYLFHWPVIWWVTPARLGLGPTATMVVQVLLTLAIAVVSYYCVEQPIRRGRVLRSTSARGGPGARVRRWWRWPSSRCPSRIARR